MSRHVSSLLREEPPTRAQRVTIVVKVPIMRQEQTVVTQEFWPALLHRVDEGVIVYEYTGRNGASPMGPASSLFGREAEISQSFFPNHSLVSATSKWEDLGDD